MIIVDCIQASQEWHQARRGVPSASNFDKILTPKKCEPSASQDKYIDQLIGDTLSLYYPPAAESFTNSAIRHGQQTEAEARRWVSKELLCDIEQVGFCLTDDGRFGFSPDGLIGEDSGLELKCPMEVTQVGYIRGGVVPSDYKPQVHGPLLIGGGLLKVMASPTIDEVIARFAVRGLKARHVPSKIKSWWFGSYHPGLPALLLKSTPDEFTAKLGAELERFWPKYQAALSLVQGGSPCSISPAP